jgi:hypothetical protein
MTEQKKLSKTEMGCKRCGLDYIHYHAPGRSKKVLALGMDKLDEDKITPMSSPWNNEGDKEV